VAINEFGQPSCIERVRRSSACGRTSVIEFIETDHWKLLATAKRFLLAADVLRRSDEYKRSKIPVTPTLHLTAHGIKMLLKANLIGFGLTLGDLRRAYGHDIWSLWNHNANHALRDEACSMARMAWSRAQNDPSWSDSFDGQPEKLLVEYLRRLSDLHTNETEYALRYVAAREMTGPRPHLLIDTFLPVADLCIRQPHVLLPWSSAASGTFPTLP